MLRGIEGLRLGPTLAHLREAHSREDRNYLGRLQDWQAAHGSRNGNVLYPDGDRLELRFAILQQHRYDFLQIFMELIEGGALRVRPLEARDKAYVKTRCRIALDHCRVSLHVSAPKKCHCCIAHVVAAVT